MLYRETKLVLRCQDHINTCRELRFNFFLMLNLVAHKITTGLSKVRVFFL